MRFFWSTIINSGSFQFWKSETEDGVKKQIVKKYCGKAFETGETSEDAYNRWAKHVDPSLMTRQPEPRKSLPEIETVSLLDGEDSVEPPTEEADTSVSLEAEIKPLDQQPTTGIILVPTGSI